VDVIITKVLADVVFGDGLGECDGLRALVVVWVDDPAAVHVARLPGTIGINLVDACKDRMLTWG
jgi:hypothetical protein